MAVNSVENELEHDRVPLFIGGDESTGSFRDDFKIRENGFVRELLESTRRTHCGRLEHRPDIGATVSASLTSELRLKIR
jgi:hypothetical protein